MVKYSYVSDHNFHFLSYRYKAKSSDKNFHVNITEFLMEHSGSVVECLTRDRGAAGSSLTGVSVLCPWERNI